ncbi:MAG: DegQ family serine endoprotease [Pseudomonadota bacterium]
MAIIATGPGVRVDAALPASVDGKPLPSLAPMLEKVTPAVVNIAAVGTEQVPQSRLMNDPFFKRFFNLPDQPRRRRSESLGSGVIVDAKRGFVLTNHHVIEKANEITVTLRDGRRFQAQVVGTDPDTDVAVIRIEPARLSALRLADSARVRVGDFVVAIGNPFGLGQTVTSGIVSALGRTGLGIEGYEDFIQTDASINVGNSGGALVNLRGELVGINTAILAPSGGNVGVGFAIPINMAADIMDQLVRHGKVRRGLLGLVAQDLTPDLAEAFGLDARSAGVGGAVIVRVFPNSAAERAGLREGDVVRSVDGRPIANAGAIRTLVGLSRVGRTLALDILRDGRASTVKATIAEPDDYRVEGGDLHRQLEGVMFTDIATQHPLYGRVDGAMVQAVPRRSAASRIGLRPGDLVIAVNGRVVRSARELDEFSGTYPDGLILIVRRGNAQRRLVLP